MVLQKIKKLKTLPQWESLTIFDFDDTIYSRVITLEKVWLIYNRWEFGNKWILAKYGWILNEEWNNIFSSENIEYRDKVSLDVNHPTFEENAKILWKEKLIKFINNILNRIGKLSNKKIRKINRRFVLWHYSKIKEDNTRIWLINNIQDTVQGVKNSVIITVGNKYLQQEKLKAVWMDNMSYKIVKSWKDKIKSLIEIILELWYIPKEITVYEDRPEFFFQYWELLSKLFWTRIVVNKVKIDNDSNILDILEERNFAFHDTDNNKIEISKAIEETYSPWNIS